LNLSKYKEALDVEILNLPLHKKPENLYDPISYILGIGGKKIRPLLCLLSCDLYSDDFQKAMPQALAVEIFHNFTLLHDDIMDKAEKRRNKPTVHIKWNEPVAILSGDLMLILAYEQVMKAPAYLQHQFFTLFSQTAKDICEGQQYDMDFEQISQPELSEYIEMIRLKTAVLLGCSLKLGALVGGSNEIDADNLYNFGINTGIAFQIIDDLLDSFGDESSFGKRIGGDILANKKTFLRIVAMQNMDAKKQIEFWDKSANEAEKIAAIKQIYVQQNVLEKAQQSINQYHQKAIENIQNLNLNESSKKILLDFAESLLQRSV
jgi:geranylgeranyl diphosphate synthase type II